MRLVFYAENGRHTRLAPTTRGVGPGDHRTESSTGKTTTGKTTARRPLEPAHRQASAPMHTAVTPNLLKPQALEARIPLTPTAAPAKGGEVSSGPEAADTER